MKKKSSVTSQKNQNRSLIPGLIMIFVLFLSGELNAFQDLTLEGPISSEMCYTGSQCEIEWEFTPSLGADSFFTLEYQKQGSSGWTTFLDEANKLNVFENTPTYTYYWQISSTLATGSYRVRASYYSSPCTSCIADYSDIGPYFTIEESDEITIDPVTSGWGDESIFNPGVSIPVSWTDNLSSVDVYLKNITAGTSLSISSGNASTSFSYSIPSNQAEGTYVIRMTGGTAVAESNQFRIEPKRITLLSPTGGEVWTYGSQPIIRWTVNYPSPNVFIDVLKNDIQEYTFTGGSNTEDTVNVGPSPDIYLIGDDFKVEVYDANASVIKGKSPATFYIEEAESDIFSMNYAKSTTAREPVQSETDLFNLDIQQGAASSSISYVDGTGRVQQSVSIEKGNNFEDVISFHTYNKIGQETISYLPYTQTTQDGAYHSFTLRDQLAYHTNGTGGVTSNSAPFSKSIVENSPAQTIKEQGAIGLLYQPGGKTIKTKTSINGASDQIIHWAVNSSGNPVGNGYYPEGVITISETIDENGNSAFTYSNLEGQEVLKTGYVDTSTPVSTYYVYDNLGNVRFIIPPEAVDDIGTNNTLELTESHNIREIWLTEISYDGYGRVIEKKIPEAEPIYTVYDKLGRVALTQDGNMRDNNEWFFTKYDIQGRSILTGVYTESTSSSQSRAGMQDVLNNWTGPTWENRTSTNYNEQHGYTFQSFPDDLIQSVIWSVTYYDDYDFDKNGTTDEQFEANSEFTVLTGNNRSAHKADIIRTNGMVTGSKTRILSPQQVFESDTAVYGKGHPTEADEVYYLGTTNTNYSVTLAPGFKTRPGQKVVIGSSDVVVPSQVMDLHTQGEWLEGVTFYDKYGRTIYTKSTNHLGGEDKSWTLYHFDGEVERTIQTHTANGTTTTVRNRFEYDHSGKLLSQYHQTNNETEILIIQSSYNSLGQLIAKGLNNVMVNGSMDATQTLDYSYHQRGWLKSVNDPENLGSDLFGYKLYYDDSPNGSSYEQYNGNISGIDWDTKILNNSNRYRYRYTYDGLNQLKKAQTEYRNNGVFESQYAPYGTSYAYNLNGNIKSLTRAGDVYYSMDALTYTYKGNQIQSISDVVSYEPYSGYKAMGFSDGASTSTEYEYDDNGSMTRDDNKGITDIRYNKMNLPEVITFNTGTQIVYLYDASGTKLSKKTYANNGTLGVSTDYVNGYIYTNNALDFFPFPEGRVRKSGGSFTYEYDLKDHLGNVRATFKSGQYNSESLLQADSYYPFGLKMPGLSYVASGTSENKFTYNGKELENDFGLDWYHYGARFYDPAVARWWAIDAADEFSSPYSYVGSNPIIFVDPDGNLSTCIPPIPCNYVTRKVLGKMQEDWDSGVRKAEEYVTDITDAVKGGIELYSRVLHGDAISVGYRLNNYSGAGGSVALEFNFLMRGEEASWLPVVTMTESIGGGSNIGGEVFMTTHNYLGSKEDLNRSMFEVNYLKDGSITYEAGGGVGPLGKFGGGLSYTNTATGYGIIGREISLSFGPAMSSFNFSQAQTQILFDMKGSDNDN